VRTAATSLISGFLPSPVLFSFPPSPPLRWTLPPQPNGDVYGVIRHPLPVVPPALVALFGVKFLAFTSPLPLILGKQVTLPVNTNPAATTDHRCTGHRARSATIEYAANTIRRLPHRSSQGKASRPSVPQTSDLTTEFIRSLGLDAVPGYGPCARV